MSSELKKPYTPPQVRSRTIADLNAAARNFQEAVIQEVVKKAVAEVFGLELVPKAAAPVQTAHISVPEFSEPSTMRGWKNAWPRNSGLIGREIDRIIARQDRVRRRAALSKGIAT